MDIFDRASLIASYTGRVASDLITITSPSLPVLRYATESLQVDGIVFQRASFQIKKPSRGTNDPPSVRLYVSGIDTDTVQLVQQVPPGDDVFVENSLVFIDSPGAIVDGPYYYRVDRVNIDSSSSILELILIIQNPVDHTVSRVRYYEKDFPALWL